jgi:DNA-binding response OmpR family regulator
MTGVGNGSRALGCRVSLLLLEDDEALRRMLVWELSELGYRVYPAGSCDEARAAIAARAFDLALMDVGLPDGDGAELAAELIETHSDLRIVLCSGRPGALAPERAPPGVLACLTKPVSVHRLDRLFRCKS